MVRRAGLVAAALAIGWTGAASAEENRYGYDKIAARDMRAAEQRLDQQRMAEPDEPSVLLNLAWVYKKTGRADAAKALYERVLAEPDVLMALGDGRPASSHMLAMKGLGRSADFAAATSPRP